MAGIEENFAKYELNFLLNDPRVWEMTHIEFRIYVILWAYCVQTRADVQHFCRRNADLAKLSGVNIRSIDISLTKLQHKCMIVLDGENTIYVCGVRNKHKKLHWKECGQNKFEVPQSRVEKNRIEKSETKVSVDIPFEEIIQDLNKLLNRKFEANESIKKVIRARWSEGHRIEQFKIVHRKKILSWVGNPKMKVHLRPSTLYRPSHFSEYLNEFVDSKMEWVRDKNDMPIYNEAQRKVIKNILAELKELR